MMNINRQVFLVTGGASGLGAATARMLVAVGGKVAIADLNQDAGEALVAELGTTNTRFILTDIADEASGRAAIEATVSAFGALHGLVNCAGIAPAEKVLGKDGPPDLALFAKVMQINLIGPFNLVRHAAAAMARNEPADTGERGVIVNTASVAAFEGQIGQAAYAASKGGMIAMALPIARELSRSGIRIMTVAPGVMETPMLLGMPQEVRDSLGKMAPFPSRLGRPAEFASLVRHIVENPYLNGEVIRLDGAIRMGAK
jgi:NAD(P)-dependent dehydrogenase (short-subunit alcohol dehydrogenase family)